MKDIVIFGAGGFGREIQWLIERINEKEERWNLLGYIDDGVEPGTEVNGYRVLGGIDKLKEFDEETAVVCAVGSARVREKIINRIKEMGNYQFPNLIHPDVQMSDSVIFGEGNIVCAGNILTVNIEVKDFVIINLSCTVGHDAILESFVTVYPGVNISGCTIINKGVELGTGSKIIQGIEIAENTIVGAGAVVVRNLPPDCTAMGIPAKPTRIFGGGYKKLLITGASGHGEVMEELAKRTGCYEEIYYLDDNSGQQEKNIRVIGGSEYAIEHKDEYDVIVAIGNAKARKQIQERYEQNGVHLVSLIHPNAILPLEDMNIGKGSVVMAGAVLQSGVELGNGVIVNTSCSIDHNCKIGNYSHIAVGSHLAGNVIVDGETWIGAGTVISNNINVCKNVMLGAGAAVIRDITEAGTYVGVPARKIK